MWWDIQYLDNELEKLEDMLFDLAASSDELAIFGLAYVLRRTNFTEIKEALAEFPLRLAVCRKSAPLVSRALSERLETLLEQTNIENLLGQLSVRIKIAERERKKYEEQPLSSNMKAYVFAFRKFIPFLRLEISLFNDKSINFENILASIASLRTVVKQLESESFRATMSDDDIFKPSNIDLNLVAIHIEEAIEHINESRSIRIDEKDRLIEYLKEAKAELIEDEPSWKKIVGAMVICATLLGGIAVVPTALENINAAVDHILGTSIENQVPKLLPEPQEKLEHNSSGQNGESQDEETGDLDQDFPGGIVT